MRKTKSQKGITLVALIITIIVLLILAVVAIGAVQNDGIINYAKNAKEQYGAAQANENTTLENYLSKLNENQGNGNSGGNGESGDTSEEQVALPTNFWTTSEDGTVLNGINSNYLIDVYEPDERIVGYEHKQEIRIASTNSIKIADKKEEVASPDYREIWIPATGEALAEDINIEGYEGNKIKITELTIPENVTQIADCAFERITVENVILPNSVVTVGCGAFRGCSSLKSITLSENLTELRDEAFKNCWSLLNVALPASLTSVEDGTFASCINLLKVDLPDSVTTIGESAFYDCRRLTEISLPSQLETIGAWAFVLCNALTEITIPDSVTQIGACAFADGISVINVPLTQAEAHALWGYSESSEDWPDGFDGIVKFTDVTTDEGFYDCMI